MSRRARRAVLPPAVFAAVLLATACAPGLTVAPEYATDSGGHGAQVQHTDTPPPGPPGITPPNNDLSWGPCTGPTVTGAPAGVTLECATFEAPLDPINGTKGQITMGAVRARSAQTPADAGPVVFTTGSDLPSSEQLPVWLTRSGTDILKSHPVVALDRRGTGRSQAVTCRDPFERAEMFDQAQFESGDDPVAKLRSTWDVPALALIGVGNGAQVALSYASAHPDKVARLVLDSPLPLAISAEAAAEQSAAGAQASINAFATQCAAVNCALGPDPKGAVSALITDAQHGRGPGGVSAAALVSAIVDALGYPVGTGPENTVRLANALAAARNGDPGGLDALVQAAEARSDDGACINRCSDALNRPTPDRVRELVVAWGKKYPQTGAVTALDLVKCLNWPSGSVPEEPKELKVDVLLLGVANNPVIGSDGVAATAAAVINAGAGNRRVMWQGIGNGAIVNSGCAMNSALSYIGDGKLPDTDTFCPA
jgi:pimeloyl-ACP methyl ester carboxylesterase